MNSALPSGNSLLQKLQHLYSSHKKASDHSVSPPAPKPFANREINQLLEKSSPIPYLQVSKQQYDIEQWTERILKQKYEKQQSCSSFTQNENLLKSQIDCEIHLQKYSQIQPISPNTTPLLAQIDKKIKLLKYAKENDHHTCAAIIAKMKLFCLDNSQSCYDFYHTTDLVLLKYMVFLLIQELNQKPVLDKPDLPTDQTSQFQQMVKDVVGIVYEIIEEIKSKQYQGSSMDTLNKQLTHIQNKFKPQLNNSTSKTISKSVTHHHRFNSCNFENCKTPMSQNKVTTEFNFSSDKFKQSLKKATENAPGSQKIIQYQIDELEQKKQTINKLHEQLQKMQSNNKQQLLQISDLTNQINSFKLQIQSKNSEVESIDALNQQLKEDCLISQSEKDRFLNQYQEEQQKNQELQSSCQQLHVELQEIQDEFEKYKQETYDYYAGQCNQLQQIKENEIASLRAELTEKQSIITQLLGDAVFFGKQYKSILDKVALIDSTNKDFQQLQKELFVSENTINAKLNAIQYYQDNLLYDGGNEYLSQSQLSTSLANNIYQNQTGNFALTSKTGLVSNICSRKNSAQEYLQAQKGQYELMHMLLVQSQVLEKFLS